MGCGSSSTADPNNNKEVTKTVKVEIKETSKNQTENEANTKNRDNGPILRQEPEIQDVEVPKTVNGYPPPRPPPNKKADIFQPAKFDLIDKKARQTPADKANSYEDLIHYLTVDCRTDLQKLRSVFVWLGCQDIENTDYSGVTESDTPRGYMKLIQDFRGSYSAFFTLLCRAAGIPCVIINGYAKSARYEVGDEEDDVKQLNNSWTSVFVADAWRFVFPLWACRAVVGHSTGAYTKVETKGMAVREKEVASSGVTVTHLNEYHFLTDPEHFIYVAYPLDSRWQLLSKTWSLQKFIDIPYCRQTYFKNSVGILSKMNGKLFTQDGYCEVELTVDDVKGFHMDYELYFNHKQSGKEISDTLQLNNYVFLNRSETKWKFGIRFPESGIYKLEIVGGRNLYESDMCYFKIICDEAQENCKPLPVNPGSIGYGPSLETVQAGLRAKSHENGLVKVSVNKQVKFSFDVLRSIQVRAHLVHKTIPKEDIAHCVRQKHEKNKLNVAVTIPEQGEYALQLHTQQKGEGEFKNVCNYLLTSEEKKKKRTRLYENPVEKNTRWDVQTFAKTKTTKDLEDLERAIERFERLDMDDKGDLAVAHDALEYKKIQKGTLIISKDPIVQN